MDVLMGSIDVRDLLSTQDLDTSSPLSAPDLRLLIDRIQVRSLHIREKVRSYVSAHHRDFADIFSRCSCASADSEAVADALSESLRILSDRPSDLDIRDLVSEIRNKRRELDERKGALALLETISSPLDRLRAAREDLRAGRLVEAVKAVNDLKVALLVEESGEEEPAVYRLLRKECSDFFDELQEVLARHAQSCVQFESENNRMIVRGRSGDVELRTAMEATENNVKVEPQSASQKGNRNTARDWMDTPMGPEKENKPKENGSSNVKCNFSS